MIILFPPVLHAFVLIGCLQISFQSTLTNMTGAGHNASILGQLCPLAVSTCASLSCGCSFSWAVWFDPSWIYEPSSRPFIWSFACNIDFARKVTVRQFCISLKCALFPTFMYVYFQYGIQFQFTWRPGSSSLEWLSIGHTVMVPAFYFCPALICSAPSMWM